MTLKERTYMDTVKFWIVFSVGVAAGATVALLIAPQAGAKTRKQLRRKLDDAADYVQDQVDDATDYVKSQTSTLSDQAAKAYKSGKSAAGDLSDSLVNNLQDAAKSVKASVS